MKKMILLLITVFSLLSITQVVGAGDYETLTGVLEHSGNKIFEIEIEEDVIVNINFGPYKYIRTTTALYNYDGVGDIETIYKELMGLVETEVTLGGVYKNNDQCFYVHTINGLDYR